MLETCALLPGLISEDRYLLDTLQTSSRGHVICQESRAAYRSSDPATERRVLDEICKAFNFLIQGGIRCFENHFVGWFIDGDDGWF